MAKSGCMGKPQRGAGGQHSILSAVVPFSFLFILITCACRGHGVALVRVGHLILCYQQPCKQWLSFFFVISKIGGGVDKNDGIAKTCQNDMGNYLSCKTLHLILLSYFSKMSHPQWHPYKTVCSAGILGKNQIYKSQ